MRSSNRLHAPMLNHHRVNSLPILCYFHFKSVYVCSCLFFMKSLTHGFDYIDNFVTFLFLCWEESYHIQK